MDSILLVIGAIVIIGIVFLAVKKKKAPKHQTGNAEGYIIPTGQVFGSQIPPIQTPEINKEPK